MPLMTRRSSARSTPRTSVGKCGSIRTHCSSLSQNRFLLINASPNTNHYRIVGTERLMSSDPSPHMAFWMMLKIGNDHFEATHLEPKVDVCGRSYVFDAYQPPNASKPFVFDPTGKCPAFVANPKI